MKLIAFSVKNYRSIKSTPRLELSRLAVIVGPNNEGKSNLLSALVCALIMAQEARRSLRLLPPSRSPYVFERDYPIEAQQKSPTAPTRFMLEFTLDETDKRDFKTLVGSKLSGTLRISLTASREGKTTFSVILQGPAQKHLNEKRAEIGSFIAQRIHFQYIGTQRREEQSQEVVRAMVEQALLQLEQSPEYRTALDLIEAAERPLLDAVSRKVEASLRPFLPQLERVEALVSNEQRSRALRRAVEMWLDDGTFTSLSQKGDGIKSLTAIALAKASAETSAAGRNQILAIEEPEAHLHSGAIHSLRALLGQISLDRQVIITTHEPALVRRDVVDANLLVEGNHVRAADSLDELRRALGIQLGENLVSPGLVVLVEGPNDMTLLSAVAAAASEVIQRAIASGHLAFISLNGARNLPYQLRFYHSLVCDTLALLDNDEEGAAAIRRARADELIDAADVFVTSRAGLKQAELEDLIDAHLYTEELCALLGVASLRPASAEARKSKWSDRLSTLLKESGKPADDIPSMLARAKFRLNQIATSNPSNCLLEVNASPVKALLARVEMKLLEIFNRETT